MNERRFEEISIWDGWATPTTRDENSTAAASSMLDSAGTIRHKVAQCIAERGPVAEWEIDRILGLSGNTARPRIWELYKTGIVTRDKNKGKTPSGRACWRYVITGLGERLLAETKR